MGGDRHALDHGNDQRRVVEITPEAGLVVPCLLYTSDAADERSSVDLGGRRIIKKKNGSKSRGALRDRQTHGMIRTD